MPGTGNVSRLHAIKKIREGWRYGNKVFGATHSLLSHRSANGLVGLHAETLRDRDEIITGAFELLNSVWDNFVACKTNHDE